MSKLCVQRRFSAERVRQEATEWSDKAVGRLGGVWGPLVLVSLKLRHEVTESFTSEAWTVNDKTMGDQEKSGHYKYFTKVYLLFFFFFFFF